MSDKPTEDLLALVAPSLAVPADLLEGEGGYAGRDVPLEAFGRELHGPSPLLRLWPAWRERKRKREAEGKS